MRRREPRIRGPFKRASLNLSVNAIVVFVLAFSMMGVGLFIITMIRGQAETIIPEAFDISLLEKEPNSQDPLIIGNELRLEANKQTTVPVGFYNKGSNLEKVAPFITECVTDDGTQVDPVKLPRLNAIAQNVQGSSAVAYKAILKSGTESLDAGSYICLVEICTKTDGAGSCLTAPSKQVYLNYES